MANLDSTYTVTDIPSFTMKIKVSRKLKLKMWFALFLVRAGTALVNGKTEIETCITKD